MTQKLGLKVKFVIFNKDYTRRQAQLSEMEESQPKNGIYLKIILGSVHQCTFPNKQERQVDFFLLTQFILWWKGNIFRFKYKDDYEKFKLALSAIAIGLSVTNLIANLR